MMRPCRVPENGTPMFMRYARVGAMSALLMGSGSTNPDLKSGPIAAMLLKGIGAGERAVHTLAFLEAGVSDLNAALQVTRI